MTDLTPAHIRRANQTGTRLDGGGDNRPPIYEEKNRVIYRASAAGKLCPRAMWLARTGVDPSPVPERLQQAFVESSNNELLAIDMFTAEYQIAVTDNQAPFEIEVPGTAAVIRGHLDGIGETEFGETGIVEIKCIAADSWERRGPHMYPGWYEQIQLQMKGFGKRICWLVFGRKVDGVVDHVSFHVVEYDPRVIGRVFDRVREVEAAYASNNALDCPEEKWGCPYWQLHEGGGPETEIVEDKVLESLTTNVARLARQVREAEDALKEARKNIKARMETLKLPSSAVVRGAGGAPYKITVVTPTRTAWDDDKLAADGVNLDDYKVKVDGNPYVKVTEQKEKE